MTKFSELTQLPADPIYGMQAQFARDSRPNKLNLSIGVCQDPNGALTKFQAVTIAEDKLYLKKPSKAYLPLTGDPLFCEKIIELVCGPFAKTDPQSVFSMQTIGGTGALYVAVQLLLKANVPKIFIPEPSWPNHQQLFSAAGASVTSYPYYNRERAELDFSRLIESVATMPKNSAIVLQASCHNPTGIDLSLDQWQKLSTRLLERKITPLFDLAYQGLGDGLDEDTASIRLFLKDGHEMLIATTLAKNFGLYNQRAAALIVHTAPEAIAATASHAKSIVRVCYSSPPAHGAQIAATLLENEELKKLWKGQLTSIQSQLTRQRKLLYDALKKQKPPFIFEHLLHTKGLFCLFDISPNDVVRLREEQALYVALDGRVCVAAITEENVSRIAEAFHSLEHQ